MKVKRKISVHLVFTEVLCLLLMESMRSQALLGMSGWVTGGDNMCSESSLKSEGLQGVWPEMGLQVLKVR